MMKIEKKSVASSRGDIEIYRLENASGAWVELSSMGAGVIGVGVPDRDGKIENVALCYENPVDYIADGPCLGKCPGRYANRIARGYLEIDGSVYQLAVNNGPNHLHGGPEGFQNQNWESRELADGVEFKYISAAGEENYPGRVEIFATYRWSEDNQLSLEIKAVTDAATVINVTNHSYWNLDGATSGTALEHEMRMKAGKYLPTDDTLVPLGMLADVAGTPMDFTAWKALGKDIKADFPAIRYGKGYDNCWAIDGWEPGKMSVDAVELRSARSGRTLTIDSDQPGVQVYTGNWLTGSPLGPGGHEYHDYDGVAVEMQGYPDAPNQKNFPSQELRPGEEYKRSIIFRFGRD